MQDTCTVACVVMSRGRQRTSAELNCIVYLSFTSFSSSWPPPSSSPPPPPPPPSPPLPHSVNWAHVLSPYRTLLSFPSHPPSILPFIPPSPFSFPSPPCLPTPPSPPLSFSLASLTPSSPLPLPLAPPSPLLQQGTQNGEDAGS